MPVVSCFHVVQAERSWVRFPLRIYSVSGWLSGSEANQQPRGRCVLITGRRDYSSCELETGGVAGITSTIRTYLCSSEDVWRDTFELAGVSCLVWNGLILRHLKHLPGGRATAGSDDVWSFRRTPRGNPFLPRRFKWLYRKLSVQC